MVTAAKKTAATKKAAPAKKATSAKAATRSSTPNIPKLPEGWAADVTFTGADGSNVHVKADDVTGKIGVSFVEPSGVVRKTSADNLAEALKKAGAGITALQKAADQQAKARKASEEALALLGDEDAGDPEEDASVDTSHDPGDDDTAHPADEALDAAESSDLADVD